MDQKDDIIFKSAEVREMEASIGKTIREYLKENPKLTAAAARTTVSESLKEFFKALDIAPPKVEAAVLWKTMSSKEKILWWLFTLKPFNKYANQVRSAIDDGNARSWDDDRVFISRIEYPPIFSPNPKAVIVFKTLIPMPAMSTTVFSGEIKE